MSSYGNECARACVWEGGGLYTCGAYVVYGMHHHVQHSSLQPSWPQEQLRPRPHSHACLPLSPYSPLIPMTLTSPTPYSHPISVMHHASCVALQFATEGIPGSRPGMACINCPHPTCGHAPAHTAVAPCPSCEAAGMAAAAPGPGGAGGVGGAHAPPLGKTQAAPGGGCCVCMCVGHSLRFYLLASVSASVCLCACFCMPCPSKMRTVCMHGLHAVQRACSHAPSPPLVSPPPAPWPPAGVLVLDPVSAPKWRLDCTK